MRTRGVVFAVVFGAAAVACSPNEEPVKPAGGGVGAPTQVTASPVTGVAREDAQGMAATAAKTPEDPGATPAVEGAAGEGAEGAGATPADLDKAAEDGFSLEKLTALAKALPVERLEELAMKLSEAIQSQLKVIEDLKGKIAGLSATDLLGDSAARLKASVEKAMSSLGPLRDKLGVVAEMLKERGIDVSKYTRLLKGE